MLQSDIKVEGGKRSLTGNKNSAPFFSIITVTYNNIETLPRCLESILVQSYRDFEVIVVDGSSTDGTREFLKDREKDIDYYVSEADDGIYSAINKGISYAHGKVIGLIHSDDILSFNSLWRYYEEFSRKNVDIVLGDCSYVNESLRFTSYKPARNYGIETIFRGITGAHEAIFIRSSTYKKYGVYDERYRSAADFKLVSSMVASGVKVGITKRLEVYKLVGGESFSKDVEFNENYMIAKEHIPELSELEYLTLIKLKNYRDRSPSDLRDLYHVINGLEANSTILRSISLSLLSIMMGDDKNVSFNRLNDRPSYYRDQFDSNRILFGIIAIKGVSGGAERVLIDLASHMEKSGKEVLVTSADGKAGAPYYQATANIDLIDIFEPPHNSSLNISIDLKAELVELIDRLPEEILLVVKKCIEFRSEFVNWQQFILLCKNKYIGDLEDIRTELLSEIDEWIRKHGGRVARWRALINSYKPGIVVPFMISSTTQMFIAARKTRAKVVLSNHGNPIRDYLYQDDWDSTNLDRALRLFSIMAAHKIHWLQDSFFDLIPHGAKAKSVAISNPVNSAHKIVSLEKRKKIILGVGRFVAVKRFDLLVKAFAGVSEKIEGWELHIYGDGPYKDELQGLINELKLGACVFLKGRTTNIFERYAESAFMVSCSEMEGFGLTVAEGLASGLPVIASKRTTGLNRLIDHGVNGILVDAKNDAKLIYEFSDAIEFCATNNEFRQKASANALLSMNMYSTEKIMRQWLGLIRKLS